MAFCSSTSYYSLLATYHVVFYFSNFTTDLGDSLLFFPLHPDGTADHDAVHGGCAVRGADDVKWIAQQWFTRSGG